MIRRPTTKDVLAASLRELARTNSMDRISIREIADDCALTPTTFYNHFENKYALMAWIYNQRIEPFVLGLGQTNSWRSFLYEAASTLEEDRAFFSNALTNTEGSNSFRRATNDYAIELINERLEALSEGKRPSESVRFLVKFYMRAVSDTIEEWFLTGRERMPLSELVGLMMAGIPQQLRPYIEYEGLDGEAPLPDCPNR
ncbi:MAG: TetR/AcrR family transcriptional regulator C-terminal domain-containing protein [Duodenibacillus sp.]|nr:TetR/AcrR family transcriptional regulator C-terminal domain-containing protein [Duodenibacillus sp.]